MNAGFLRGLDLEAGELGRDAHPDILIHSAHVSWPYHSMCRTLLHTLPESSSVIAANKKMLDDIASILRDEQEMVCTLSERVFRQTSKFGPWDDAGRIRNIRELEEMFAYAADNIRKIGAAVTGAQVEALARLREAAIACASAVSTSEKNLEPPVLPLKHQGDELYQVITGQEAIA